MCSSFAQINKKDKSDIIDLVKSYYEDVNLIRTENIPKKSYPSESLPKDFMSYLIKVSKLDTLRPIKYSSNHRILNDTICDKVKYAIVQYQINQLELSDLELSKFRNSLKKNYNERKFKNKIIDTVIEKNNLYVYKENNLEWKILGMKYPFSSAIRKELPDKINRWFVNSN